jgi:hypothetical protein
MKKDNIFIFDLDGTTINSDHRQGHGSLVSWFRNNTRENIFRDIPMYLGQFRRSFRELGINCKAWDIPFAIERFNHIFGWSKIE